MSDIASIVVPCLFDRVGRKLIIEPLRFIPLRQILVARKAPHDALSRGAGA